MLFVFTLGNISVLSPVAKVAAADEIVKVSDGTTIGSPLTTTVEVRAYEHATIHTTLPAIADACPGFVPFIVGTVANDDANRMVRARITLQTGNPDDVVQEYRKHDGSYGAFEQDENASNVVYFGPASGFPVIDGESEFRIDFKATGTYKFLVELIDVNDTSVVVGIPLTYTVTVNECDTTAPVVTVDQLTTTDTSPELTGTIDDPTAVMSVIVNGVTYTAEVETDGNTWRLPAGKIAPDLAPGTYDVVVKAEDTAGNVGQATGELVITAPANGGIGGDPKTRDSNDEKEVPQDDDVVVASFVDPLADFFAQGSVQSDTTDDEDDGETSSISTENNEEDKEDEENQSGFNWPWFLGTVAVLGATWWVWRARQQVED